MTAHRRHDERAIAHLLESFDGGASDCRDRGDPAAADTDRDRPPARNTLHQATIQDCPSDRRRDVRHLRLRDRLTDTSERRECHRSIPAWEDGNRGALNLTFYTDRRSIAKWCSSRAGSPRTRAIAVRDRTLGHKLQSRGRNWEARRGKDKGKSDSYARRHRPPGEQPRRDAKARLRTYPGRIQAAASHNRTRHRTAKNRTTRSASGRSSRHPRKSRKPGLGLGDPGSSWARPTRGNTKSSNATAINVIPDRFMIVLPGAHAGRGADLGLLRKPSLNIIVGASAVGSPQKLGPIVFGVINVWSVRPLVANGESVRPRRTAEPIGQADVEEPLFFGPGVKVIWNTGRIT